LLHRLLSDYPRDRLIIIETATPSQPERRLPKVTYISHPVSKQRWLNTRFHSYVAAWFTYTGKHFARRFAQSLNGFDVDGVLTVAHGFGWLAAASFARERKVPLHLMVHDDWPRVADVPASFRKRLDRDFASVYQQARSRLCVSPAMSRTYFQRYGQPGTVIYPGRPPDFREFADPPGRLARTDHPFTIAFAGTINSNGYAQALLALQDALKAVSGQLLVFGPLTREQARLFGLDSTTTVCGLLGWSELVNRLREEADALFVPMSFDLSDKTNMELAFPSKLADCTAIGLPLLIYGPSYCSAIAWARENPGVAEIVETDDGLRNAVSRLATDAIRRVAFGRRALEVGCRYFTHASVQGVFHQTLSLQSPN
jgi:hypothetical protein